jgi:tetratricopeptide (TPR) repeat protein
MNRQERKRKTRTPAPFRETARALVLALAALVLWQAQACAPKHARETPEPPEKAAAPADWRLSKEAEATYLFLLFEEAKRDQNQEIATDALNRLLEIDPSPRIYLEGANHYWLRGELGEARSLLKKGIESHPGNKQLSRTLATTYLAEKRYDDAAVTLRSYLAEHPEDREIRQELAAILIEGGRYAEALDMLQAVAEEQRSAAAYYYMAKARTGLGLTRKAVEDLKTALEMKPEFVEAWAELAYLYEVEKDLVKAEQIYSRILDLGETGREVWLRLIILNIKLNNPEKAMAYYRQGPDDVDFALEAATAFLDENLYDQARNILVSLQDRGEAPAKINFYLAVLAYEADNDPGKALEYLRRIPEENTRYAQSLRFRIQLHMEMNEYDKALELVRRGQDRFPDSDSFEILESRIHEDRGRLEKARQVLEEALVKWPNNTDVLYSLGVVLDKMQKPDAAMQIMEKIIAVDPDHADALNFLGYTLADLNRDLDRAQVLVRKAMELKPGSGYITDSLAWVYYRRGNLQKAWEIIQDAAELVKSDPIVWEHYGDIARDLGMTEQARKGYRRSLELKADEDVRQKLEAL